MFKYNLHNNQGQSIIEIVIAAAIFVLLAGSVVSLLLGSYSTLERSRDFVLANGLAEEGLAALSAIRNQSWNELVFNRSAVTVSANKWKLSGAGTSEQIGRFTRIIDFAPVYRDAGFEITEPSDPGAFIDILSQEISITVNWPVANGQSIGVNRTIILSNWNALDWTQDDWTGGSGQAVWQATDRYDSDDNNIETGTAGRITLKEIATSTLAATGELISSAFDTGRQASFSALEWAVALPPACAECAIKLQIKTAPDSAGLPGEWTSIWAGPDGDDGDEDDFFTLSTGELISTDHNFDQWIKYKIILTGDSADTPTVTEIKLYYQ